MSKIFDALRRIQFSRSERHPQVQALAEAGPEPAPLSTHPASRPERRRTRRASVKVAARVRSYDAGQVTFEEVHDAVNASRLGFYFITDHPRRYRPGMRLRVAFPYAPGQLHNTAMETNAEVMRVERLADGTTGVAVLLRGASVARRAYSGTFTPATHRPGERRRAARSPFSAFVAAVDPATRLGVEGRCSDLSPHGCYVDTLSPFPEDAVVDLRLEWQQEWLEVRARVASSYPGLGMGLAFERPGPRQTAVLERWLGAHAPAARASTTL